MPVTDAILREWHRELNETCFDGTLPDTNVYLGLMRGADAPKFEYEGCYNSDSVGRGTIFINPAFEANAKAILAHEMIHQWQDLCLQRLDHRAIFHAWCARITELTGLVP